MNVGIHYVENSLYYYMYMYISRLLNFNTTLIERDTNLGMLPESIESLPIP